MSISVMLFVLGWHHSKLRNWATICVDTTNDDELGCSVFFLSLVWFCLMLFMQGCWVIEFFGTWS
jgi:hypothetical protein